MMRIRSVFNSRFLKITEKNQFLKTFWIKVSNKSLYRAEINFDKYHEAATGLRGYVEAISYVKSVVKNMYVCTPGLVKNFLFFLYCVYIFRNLTGLGT